MASHRHASCILSCPVLTCLRTCVAVLVYHHPTSLQVIRKKLAWMDVKDAQEAAKAAGQEEMEKEKQLKEARSAAKGDERPAKWVCQGSSQRSSSVQGVVPCAHACVGMTRKASRQA
jgi:rubrerythrin